VEGEYEPGTLDWAREQAELIEASGGTEGTEMNGMRVVVVTCRAIAAGSTGARSRG
jgi:hypothetical protein